MAFFGRTTRVRRTVNSLLILTNELGEEYSTVEESK